MKKAVVLLSGGMDSAVTLYIAKQEHECSVLIFDYGQKAAREIECAVKLAQSCGCPYKVLRIDLPWKGSALLDAERDIPSSGESSGGGIPDTYVPARNIIFLSYGLSYAEACGAGSVFIGAHQLDYSNYPDCREEFFRSFQKAADQGTRAGVEEASVKIRTPVLN
ncbi:MAG: 7-cyano-7-deazaguanine synthase, partial [Candidatus Omnitrophica bacterium]|nr:7-cyano-7-deazaguanine synthase [Candidatus Omnitrophota bacterium]